MRMYFHFWLLMVIIVGSSLGMATTLHYVQYAIKLNNDISEEDFMKYHLPMNSRSLGHVVDALLCEIPLSQDVSSEWTVANVEERLKHDIHVKWFEKQVQRSRHRRIKEDIHVVPFVPH